MLSSLTGDINRPLKLLASTIVRSTTFRTLCGGDGSPATPEQALSRVHAYDIPDPEAPGEYGAEEMRTLRPLCVVAPAVPEVLRVDFSTHHTTHSSGVIGWVIEADVPPNMESDVKILCWWTDTLGAMIEELRLVHQAGGDMSGLLDVSSYKVEVFDRADEAETAGQGDHVWALIIVKWGVQ